MASRARQWFAWRRWLIWLGVLAVVGAVLCALPLFDILGYEFSLVIAVVASLAAGHVAAGYPARVRAREAPFPGAVATVWRLYVVVAALGLALLVPPLALIALNSLRVRLCDPLEGLAFYALGPVLSVCVAAAWGLLSGLTFRSSRVASAVWVLVFFVALGAELYDGWVTPTVRAFGSFHGYFSGVLYDEDVTIPTALLTFRARDAIETLALLLVARWLIDRSELRLRLSVAHESRRHAVSAALVSAVALAGFLASPALGHRRTTADVARALGGRTVDGRCALIHSRRIPAEEARRLARDCAFRLHQVETTFGIEYEGDLTVLVFDSPEHKQELLGAGRTSVAKPWRREVYIQGAAFPHPVLRHEIAHVVSGTFGAQPLAVSGRLGGLLVSPGMVEGAAVAADWDEPELTPHEWSLAMQELGVAPPLPRVLGLGFLSLNASRAYVLAGSFSRFLLDTHGAARYRQAYRTADLEGVYGATLSELEQEWLSFIRTRTSREGDLELARDRFDRPAVFGKVCAHEVAQLRGRAARCEGNQEWAKAARLRRLVVRYSASDGRSRFELARTLLSAGRTGRSVAMLEALAADESSPRAYRRAASELVADVNWVRGQREDALRRYRALAEAPALEPQRRMIAVKIAALEDPVLEPFLRRFLLGGDAYSPEAGDLGMLTLSELLRERPSSALGNYLLGRQLWQREEDRRALPYLRRARREGLRTEALAAENQRLIAISLFRTGRLELARTAFRALAEDEARPPGARALARDWIERCDWEARRRQARTDAAARR